MIRALPLRHFVRKYLENFATARWSSHVRVVKLAGDTRVDKRKPSSVPQSSLASYNVSYKLYRPSVDSWAFCITYTRCYTFNNRQSQWRSHTSGVSTPCQEITYFLVCDLMCVFWLRGRLGRAAEREWTERNVTDWRTPWKFPATPLDKA